jgi:hypothetical protein
MDSRQALKMQRNGRRLRRKKGRNTVVKVEGKVLIRGIPESLIENVVEARTNDFNRMYGLINTLSKLKSYTYL